MTVPMKEMERIIKAVTYKHADCIYYSPDEITSDMIDRRRSDTQIHPVCVERGGLTMHVECNAITLSYNG